MLQNCLKVFIQNIIVHYLHILHTSTAQAIVNLRSWFATNRKGIMNWAAWDVTQSILKSNMKYRTKSPSTIWPGQLEIIKKSRNGPKTLQGNKRKNNSNENPDIYGTERQYKMNIERKHPKNALMNIGTKSSTGGATRRMMKTQPTKTCKWNGSMSQYYNKTSNGKQSAMPNNIFAKILLSFNRSRAHQEEQNETQQKNTSKKKKLVQYSTKKKEQMQITGGQAHETK